jgi:hypothetical protein
MSELAKSVDDLILDGLVAKVKFHRDADVHINAAYNYNVERDKTSPWQRLTAPLVNITQESDDGKNSDYVAKYSALCLVPVIDEDDAVATSRLLILKEQIKKSLLDNDDPDLGLPVGTIGKMSAPAWQRVKFDDDKLNQEILVGEWSFEISYGYEPLDLTLVKLDSISAKVGDLAALYQF